MDNEFVMNADKTIVYSYVGDAEEVVVPEGVVFIAPNAFLNNQTMKKVTLPTTIKAIGDKAFYGVEKLGEVVILSDKAPLLYARYDENYAKSDWFYQNFISHIDYVEGLILTHKADASFDSLLWKSYFTEHYLLLEDGSVVPEYTKETEEENDANALNESVAAPSAIRRNGFEDNAVVFAVIDVAENGKYGKLASEAVSNRVVHIPSNVCVY